MRQYPFSTHPKEALQTRAWNKSPVLGRKPGADPVMSPPIAVPSRFGHDFTGIGLRPAADAARTNCSLFPQRCPFGGACHLCPPRIQAKLKIGAPADHFEKEADRVAARVADGTPAILQRATGAMPPIRTAPAEVYHPLAEPGQPLADEVREPMEQGFGHDFKAVRIHANTAATRAARAVNALAFTVGRHIVFQRPYYKPQSATGRRLLAHELTHVVQQTGGAPLEASSGGSKAASTSASAAAELHKNSRSRPQLQRLTEEDEDRERSIGSAPAGILQRAGAPSLLPSPFPCPTDLTTGRPAGTDILFATGRSTITASHTTRLTAFRDTWVAAGGSDDILVHGYASEPGDQGDNWTLSCNRALAVKAELVRLGIPDVRISIVAHGESTDFGTASTPNEHAVVSSSPGGILPLVFGTLTPNDNFSGRSTTRFGVGETLNLGFGSFPSRPAADFGGLEWHLASGTGTLSAVTPAGTATYTAPARASAERLELRVAAGATAGQVVSRHPISIIEPSALRLVAVAGSFPSFGGWGNPPIAAGTWGAGFRGDEFIDPKDVSFQGVVFGEGSVAGVVTGSFLSGWAGTVHPANTHGPGLGGNATTGTPVSQDGVWMWGGVTPGSFFGIPTCGASSFLWAIPWEFSVAGGPRTPFAGGFVANHLVRSNFLCHAIISKAGAGPFCRRIDGTTC